MVRKRQCCKGVEKSIATAGNSRGDDPEMRNVGGCFGDPKRKRAGAWNIENREKVKGDGVKGDTMLQILQGLTGHG